MIQLLLGNCLDQLKTLSDNSIDSIITDPPYGLSFMGKSWDYDVPTEEIWRECLRVLKPGGHLLAFFGTRTYHRGVVRIEDAGFEIRDQIMWIYGSGFPKSHNIGKAIDKTAGIEREVIGTKRKSDIRGSTVRGEWQGLHKPDKGIIDVQYTAPATELAKKWDGWGTALKPANEPIVVARKPLEKGLTIAENVVKWGCGAINIDECRITYQSEADKRLETRGVHIGKAYKHASGDAFKKEINKVAEVNHQGRWPANIMFDEGAAAVLDEQVSKTMKMHGSGQKKSFVNNNDPKNNINLGGGNNNTRFDDSDSSKASRFFYVAKASKSERNKGLDGMAKKDPPGSKRSTPAEGRSSALGQPRENFHPTVKPVKLMEYLIKLVTPPSGTVLDPFMGSGTTGVAAKYLGFSFIGCELSEEYLEIAQQRIADAKTSKTSS